MPFVLTRTFVRIEGINLVLTKSGVISMFDKTSYAGAFLTAGMLPRFSVVKTLVKKSFNVSALSLALIAFVPSLLVSVGMACLDFSRDLAYFQNNFGFSFTSFAIFISKLFLRFLDNITALKSKSTR